MHHVDRAARFRLNPWMLTALILSVGVAVRFMQMGLIRYSHDQSYPAFQALGLLDAGVWPLIGQPSSVFLDNPALMPYLQALPLLLFRSPWAVQGFILVLNSAAVWFVWRTATDMLGRRAGWLAAFVFAVNPWVVFFSRMTWVQSLLPFFMAVIAWGLWPTFVDERAAPRRFLAGGVAVTLMTQTYIQAWGVLPQIVLLLIFFRRRVPKRAFLAAVGVFLAATLLYILGLSTRADVNTTKAAGFLAEGWQGLTSIGLRHALRLVNGIDFRSAYAAGNPPGRLWPTLSAIAVIIMTVAFLSGLIQAGLALRREGRERRLATVLLSWFFIPVLLTSLKGVFDIHPHYLLLTLPAGQILAAWGVAPLLRTRSHAATISLLMVTGLIFAHELYRANELVARQPTMPEFNGWSLAAGAEVGRAMREMGLSDPGTYPRRVVAEAEKEILSGLSATYVQPIRGVAYPDFIVLSAEQPLLYVIEGDGDIPLWLTPFFDAGSTRTISNAPGTQFAITKTLPAVVAQLADQPATQVEWPSEAGTTLVGYTLSGATTPGGMLDLITYWRVDELSPDRSEWYVATSYHLVDEIGGLINNIGIHGQWAHRWELGDVYVERITIPLPELAKPGDYSLEIGLFDSVRLQPYMLFGDGAPIPAYRIPVTIEAN